MVSESISEKILNLRQANKITQKELAEQLGLTNRAVSKWENGISTPTIENIVKLSKIFHVPVEYFFSQDENEDLNENAKNGMESLKELYRMGRGPSSSHSIGPEYACRIFKEQNKYADSFKAILYGSLAKTGKGHGTENVIKKVFLPERCTVEFDFSEEDLPHPNTFDIIAFRNRKETARERVMSIGGGKVRFENKPYQTPKCVYNLTQFSDIAEYCNNKGLRIWEYVVECEDDNIYSYIYEIWQDMKISIEKGLKDEGVLPGGLEVQKKAKQLFSLEHIDETSETRENRLVCSYAFAVSEQNASGERIVTAPTCGASGVVPAVLYYQQKKHNLPDDRIVKALMTGGIIGNLIKTNASISGAECGCQAEIGTACAMAAAALGELFGLSIDKIEYAAEISIEHHLGLTCDPIGGLVQIPCIERNAVAAMRAINAVNIASFLSDTRRISLDNVIEVMRETGIDIKNKYKETAEGGLAKIKLK